MKYIYGVDIGGTNIKIGLFNDKQELILKDSIPTNVSEGGKFIAQDIKDKLEEIIIENNINEEEIIGVGFGIPGPVKNNFVEKCPNINWEKVDIVEEFRKYFPSHYIIESANDANIAALGEYGLIKENHSDIVFITLGTGVGGGIIIDGEIHEGTAGFGGEIGHMPLDETYNFECGCGNFGCIETVASATGLVRIAKKHIENDNQIDDLSAKNIFDLAKQNDDFALKMVEIYTRYLGKMIANISVVLNPSAYIIGGGVSAAGEFLVEKVRKYYLENVSFDRLKDVEFNVAKLGNDAGIYGASLLIKNKTH